MCIRVAGGFYQLINNVGCRCRIGVAHAEIDEFQAVAMRSGLLGVHFGKSIGGSTLYAMDFKRHVPSSSVSAGTWLSRKLTSWGLSYAPNGR